MIDYNDTIELLKSTKLHSWSESLACQIKKGFNISRWGDIPKWENIISTLPDIKATHIDLNQDVITIKSDGPLEENIRLQLERSLRQLHPWRKGPFNLFGVHIDTEWRSDMKWNRLKNSIEALKGRKVLDIGCGSGYHCWRMAGAGASLVIGIDPTPLYVYQFQALQKYINMPHVNVFPLGIDDMPQELQEFDAVFSMGLLYHRRAPIDHLLQLFSLLREGGEIVLETLVIEGVQGEVLAPNGRYAKMPNVWFIPSVSTLEYWLKRAGFEHIRCIDVTQTTAQEQRSSEWMGFHSLKDFLDPQDPNRTIEGYPAPRRAILTGRRP